MKRPTIYDVAQRAGVSKSLVSLVLRGSPRVSDEKREAVLAAVAELDYTPSRLAAGLAGTRTRSIGVLVDELENLWFAPALEGLRQALGSGGYSLTIADAALNAHVGQGPLEVFGSLRVDGVVLAGEVDDAAVARLQVPAVVLGTRALRAPGAPVVTSDERLGGRLATAHLADLGHRDIVCVSAPGASAGAREAGYLAEMRERGLEPRIVRADRTSEAAARAVVEREIFGGPSRGRGAGSTGALRDADARTAGPPTAVFAVNDPMAVGVIGAAMRRGLAVPDDLSVVGYDDSPLAAYELVSLTTVSGDPRELGEAAGHALVALIEGGADLESSRFEPRVVVRTSTSARGDVGPAVMPAPR
ncbi:LacI family transcriptional regulator [Leucobacter zeae]|nr:LacI family transcriptional regulator [Leucobacter zeae]